jgi:hypothetical protein
MEALRNTLPPTETFSLGQSGRMGEVFHPNLLTRSGLCLTTLTFHHAAFGNKFTVLNRQFNFCNKKL